MTELLDDGPADAAVALLLAHGAGAAMDSPFMNDIAGRLVRLGVRVLRFEFAFMSGRRRGGSRRPPPAAERLVAEFDAAIAAASARLTPLQPLAIGGKSLGGRVASLVADRHFTAGRVNGLVCLGFPLHPPGRPDGRRGAHLAAIRCPALIVQGERDPFGGRDEFAALAVSAAVRLHWAFDGDHDLGPRGRAGVSRASNLDAAARAVARHLLEHCR
jgi:hypothetical protein